jgi:hypothetical protein
MILISLGKGVSWAKAGATDKPAPSTMMLVKKIDFRVLITMVILHWFMSVRLDKK